MKTDMVYTIYTATDTNVEKDQKWLTSTQNLIVSYIWPLADLPQLACVQPPRFFRRGGGGEGVGGGCTQASFNNTSSWHLYTRLNISLISTF